MLSLYCDRSSGCSLQVCPCCGKLMMSTSGLSAPSSAPSGSVGWSGGLSIGSSAQLLVTVSVTNVGTVLVAKGSTTMRSCSSCPAEVDAWVDGPAEVVAATRRLFARMPDPLVLGSSTAVADVPVAEQWAGVEGSHLVMSALVPPLSALAPNGSAGSSSLRDRIRLLFLLCGSLEVPLWTTSSCSFSAVRLCPGRRIRASYPSDLDVEHVAL